MAYLVKTRLTKAGAREDESVDSRVVEARCSQKGGGPALSNPRSRAHALARRGLTKYAITVHRRESPVKNLLYNEKFVKIRLV